jgi:hypothetical protein
MDASTKPLQRQRSPTEDFFDLTIKYVAVWGVALSLGEATNRVLHDVLPYGWRIIISLLAVYLFALIFFWGGTRRSGLRDSFLAWRYPIAMLLAAYAGYQLHIYDYGRSQEARLNEAARWACAKNVSCQKAAVDYLADKEL